MRKIPESLFYANVAADVIRSDWKRKKGMYPRLFNVSMLSNWMGVSTRMLGYKLNSDKPWNVTFEELCRYADGTGNDVQQLFEAIMNRIKEFDGGVQGKRKNSEIRALMDYHDGHNFY